MVETYEALVDHREHDDLISELSKIDNLEVEVAQLPVGDVVCDPIGIEHKTVDDFLGSVWSDRVFRQCKELRDNFEVPIVVITGDPYFRMSWIRGNADNTHKAYLGALASMVRYGVPMVSLRNYTEYTMFVRSLVKKLDPEGGSGSRPVRTNKSRDRSPRDVASDVLCAFDNVGRGTADKILEERTPVEFLSGDVEDMWEIDGVGGKTAEHIYSVMQGEWDEE